MHSQLVVLGGGPGGYAAAFLAADKGMQVTLVDAEPRLGGTCLLRGCIPSKALLHVARVIAETHEMKDWGLEFGSMKLDVAALRARKEKVIATLSGGLKQLAKQRKVKVIHARGTFLNSGTLILEPRPDGERPDDLQLSYDHCILATGSRPTKIAALDLPSDRVMDSTEGLEVPDVPPSLLVVGGGYIGLEMATVYAALGSKVTIVEMTPGLLPGADRDLVKPLHQRLEKTCDAIYLETKVASLADAGSQIEVKLAGPQGEQTRKFDRVLVSVGRRPNSDGLGLENTKVRISKRGFVEVDAQRRTADEQILAIGDVAGEPMLAHKATHEGKVAVEALLGEPAAFEPLAIPAVVFTDPEVAWAGLSETAAKEAGQTVEVARYPWAASGRAQALGRTEGLTKVVVEPGTERVLGVGIVGTQAGDLISEGVVAIEMGCTLRDLAESIHPHPTLSETVGNAAELLLGTATEIYRPKRAERN
jgi:dihydrolipoamide dehydrogenase